MSLLVSPVDSAATAAKQEDLLPLETRLYALSYAKGNAKEMIRSLTAAGAIGSITDSAGRPST